MFLEFEQPIAELEGKIQELQHLSDGDNINITNEILRIKNKLDKLKKSIYKNLTPWQKVQVARHASRPHFTDYIKNIFTNYIPLAGDRYFGDDNALLGGFATIKKRKCMVIGHERGNNTQNRIKHNFGMAKPEGYRKAKRLMQLAEKSNLPLISLVDTPGAYPGISAEERGQAEAIASCIETSLEIKTPIISIITGEGGSGGAIAIAIADRVLMLEHAVYSVISPEGCASILWRTPTENQTAAQALKLTAQDLKKLEIIDTIIEEPIGGAHRTPDNLYATMSKHLTQLIDELSGEDSTLLLKKRRQKYLQMGR